MELAPAGVRFVEQGDDPIRPESKTHRRIEAARGYLTLRMPSQALRELSAIDDPGRFAGEVCLLSAESLRQLKKYSDALDLYDIALARFPTDTGILTGMAWCFKRLDDLPRAIESTLQAYRLEPENAVLLYNLACYYSLADDKAQALSWLGRALRLDRDLCRLIPSEPDFDSIRHDRDFRFIVESCLEADE